MYRYFTVMSWIIVFFILFSVLAVAIFSFRKTNLLKVQSYNAAEVIIHSHILVIYIPTITDTLEKFEHKKLVNLFTNRIKTASVIGQKNLKQPKLAWRYVDCWSFIQFIQKFDCLIYEVSLLLMSGYSEDLLNGPP